MIGGAQIIQVNNDEFTPSFRDVGVRDACRETTDAIVGRAPGNCVINVNKPVAGEIRIESDSQKATFEK